MYDYLNGKPYTWIKPQESTGAVPVSLQDQITEPLDALFAQSISNFTLAVDTGASGISPPFVYSFTASPGHGIAVNDEILLLDPPGNRSFFAKVLSVAVDVIGVDRPIDHVFPAATSLGRRVLTKMNVVGSLANPQVFSIRSGAIPTDITRMLITMLDSSAMDDGTFGGMPALTNGLVFRIVNSFQKTIFNFKTNGDIKQFCYDVSYSGRAPAGQEGLAARITFAGMDKHGVALRIQGTDVAQWLVQDDLTPLDSLLIAGEGHFVQD
jgi:hypothetical protein